MQEAIDRLSSRLCHFAIFCRKFVRMRTFFANRTSNGDVSKKAGDGW
jgi:hypothetical protein